jgi:hypothetical protein
MRSKPNYWPRRRLTTLVVELPKLLLKLNAKLKPKLTLFKEKSSKLKLLLQRNKLRRKLLPRSLSRERSPKLSERPRRKKLLPRKMLN